MDPELIARRKLIPSLRARVRFGIATSEETNQVNLEDALTRAQGRWAPYVEWVEDDPDGLPYHAHAIHARGSMDREGRYLNRADAELAANDYAMKLCRDRALVKDIIRR